MKTIPSDLSYGTLVFGIRVVRQDGTVFGWTQHDVNSTVNVDGEDTLLLSNPGFTIQSLVSTAGLGVDTTDIYVIDGDDMTRADILMRKWDGAEVYFFRYDWTLPSAGIIPIKRGSFGNFQPMLGQFKVEFRDFRQALQANSTWVFQETCRWRLGDARCGIDLTGSDGYTVTASVTGVTSQRVFTASGLTQADDFFGEGFLTWTGSDGLNVGTPPFKVKAFAAGVVTLSEPTIQPIQTGDTFTIVAGCRKRWEEDCKTKFDNLLRFGGEKDKPLRDDLVAIPA